MRISIEVMPKDVPGELVRILTPIADVGGNVISIIHKRDEQSSKGRLPVRLTFDIDSKAQYEKILERYKNENTRVINGGEVKNYREIVVGMIGHIVHTDLSETIRSIDSLGFCNVTGMELDMPAIDKESCAILRIGIESTVTGGRDIVKSRIQQICSTKNIQVIDAI